MKLWLIPVCVVLAAGIGAAAVAFLPPAWAFLGIASCLVIALGAAPVVFAVYTRRMELRSQAVSRTSPTEIEHKVLK